MERLAAFRRAVPVAVATLLVMAALADRAQAEGPGRGASDQQAAPTGQTTPDDAFGEKVRLRVGPHRFRIPRAYFRHPPHPSGVDTGFYIRALWPGMEPETEANRAAFRASIRTEEGRRVLQILLQLNQPHMPWPVARWMLENSARSPSREEADRADLEAFAPPSPETFGMRALLARPRTVGIAYDLFHGMLADGRFVAVQCGREPDPDRLTSCQLWFDWREGTWLQVTFIRTQLPKWREIAEATLALVDGFAAEDGGR